MLTLPEITVKDMWQSLKEETRPIVIYGMGNGADKLIARLESLGIKFADIFASDGFVRGHSFHGIRVKSFSEIKELYPDFVILLSFATRLSEVIDLLCDMNEKYDLYVPDMPVSEAEIFFDSAFYSEHYKEIEEALERLEDKDSKNLYISLIRYKLSGRIFDLLAFTSTKEEMYSLISTKKINTYCDVGAYNGDTLKEALSFFSDLKSAVCIEPDPKTFKRLERFAATVENSDVECINAAAWSETCDGELSSSRNRNTSVKDASTASYEHKSETVSLITVDSLRRDFDYLKYDVEGAEREALWGSDKTICKSRPVLLVSLYHKSRDIFELINLLYKRYEGYRFYLKRLKCLPAWEINLIMIPAT